MSKLEQKIQKAIDKRYSLAVQVRNAAFDLDGEMPRCDDIEALIPKLQSANEEVKKLILQRK